MGDLSGFHSWSFGGHLGFPNQKSMASGEKSRLKLRGERAHRGCRFMNTTDLQRSRHFL